MKDIVQRVDEMYDESARADPQVPAGYEELKRKHELLEKIGDGLREIRECLEKELREHEEARTARKS